MKKILYYLMLGLVVLSLVACSSAAAATQETKTNETTSAQAEAPTEKAATKTIDFTGDWWLKPYQAEKEWVIGVSYPNLQFPFCAALQKAIQNKAAEMGVKLIEVDAALDTNKELANVENLIAQKVDAILFTGASADASVASIEAANKAGIPVIQYNGKANGGDYVSFVGSEHIESGHLLGQWLLDLRNSLGKDTLKGIYLRGVAGQITDIARYDGVMEKIKDAGLTDKFTFVEQYADYDRSKGQSVTESILQQSKDYDFIIANNDDMVLGALAALDEFGLKGKMPAAGVDGLPESLNEIKNGNLSATVFQNPEGQAQGSLMVAVYYLEGGKPAKDIMIPFILVTKDNVDSVLEIANRIYVQ